MNRWRLMHPARGSSPMRSVQAALVAGFVAGVGGCGPERTAPLPELEACSVSHLSDGDSLRCLEGNERVRLLLIDAPEIAQSPWGDSARAALARLLPEGGRVRLEYDTDRRDDFGRLLAYLWLDDGRLVNEEMARAGYVVLLHYPPNDRYLDRIGTAVAEAEAARRGLWATSAFDCRPVDFRAGRCGGG